MQGAPPASHTGHGSEVGRGCAAGPAEGDWAASSPRCTTAWNAPVYSGLYTSLTPISPLALHCRPLCSRLRARRCGKASRQSLRADLGPKGSVGGQGSPPRSVHEAIQVSPHFYDHLKGWSEEQTEACIDREQEQPWLDRKALQTFGCWAGCRFDRSGRVAAVRKPHPEPASLDRGQGHHALPEGSGQDDAAHARPAAVGFPGLMPGSCSPAWPPRPGTSSLPPCSPVTDPFLPSSTRNLPCAVIGLCTFLAPSCCRPC